MKYKKELANILLVEDNIGDVRLLEIKLRRKYFNVNLYHVQSGEEAIDFLMQAAQFGNVPRPDLILLDVNLPQCSGHDVARFIRKDPLHKDMPIYMLTSSEHYTDLGTAQDNSVDAYFTKPLCCHKFKKVTENLNHLSFQTSNENTDLCRL